MKTFKNYITESDVKDDPYHGKKMTFKTQHFDGVAHIKYNKSIGKRSNDTREYTVKYKGKMSNGDDTEYNHRMVVNFNDGKPYSHKLNGKTSKKVTDVIRNSAPTWVHLSQLQPK